MCGGGGDSGGSSSTVTQVQQIPAWQQEYAQTNEDIAAALAKTEYPTYEGQLIAGFTPYQEQGMQMASDSANAYQNNLQQAENLTAQGAGTWNADVAQQYMSPYTIAALQPQIQQLQQQQAQNAMNMNAQATGSGAFGDARLGVEQSLDKFYNQLAMSDLVAQGMNTAYNTGQQAFQNDMSRVLNAGQQYGTLGEMQQNLGLQGSNALFNAGTQQQELEQQQLNTAYQNFLNQSYWPIEMLNLRMAALSNSAYATPSATLAPTNSTAQNIGSLASLAGGLGSLFGGGSSSKTGTFSGGGGQSIFGASDRRVKKWISKIGELVNGLNVYAFAYLWDDTPRVGVMADELEKVNPGAVLTTPLGYKIVNYSVVW